MYEKLEEVDPFIEKALKNECERQNNVLELIASENFVSVPVLKAMGSVMTNKYAEGYPGKRYYGGCGFVDKAERKAIERAKKLFDADHVNVQPHSGTQANMAVYFNVLEPGDTILGMKLDQGGHLSHGHPVNFSGKFYNVIQYGVDKETELLDYEKLKNLTLKHNPDLIVTGASAYSRVIDFERIAGIASETQTPVMADIAHIAGLIAGGEHPNPFPHCDFVTTTTHKTLRGPRGGMIMCKEDYAEDLDKAVFPGTQGGPLMHVIASKAVCFKEALEDDFREYQKQIIKNAEKLSRTLSSKGYRIVSGGTDTHLFLVDLSGKGITGKEAEEILERSGITVNKNTVPFDSRSPFVTSGLRMGTSALTTRGMKEKEMERIGDLIHRVLSNLEKKKVFETTREEVESLCRDFPIYEELRNS